MPSLGYIPEVFTEFLGEDTLHQDVQSVPKGRSPSCSNVQFRPNGVRSRPGLTTVATFTSASVLSLAEFTMLDVTQKRTIALTSDGKLWSEPNNFTYVSFASDFIAASVATTAQMSSTTIFGRQYMALSATGTQAAAVPRAWNDTNFDPIAPGGPAGAPTLAAGGAGSVSAGPHYCRVMFRTRNGFLTAPGPSGTFTFSGATSINVTTIPIGPAYVVGRVLVFTPTCNSTQFYFVAGGVMDIWDNTTTTVNGINFTDSTLISGTQVMGIGVVADLSRLINLPQQAAVFSHKSRLAWVGELNAFVLNGDIGFQNTAFDGGFSGGNPLGWTVKIGGGTKGGTTGGVGDVLRIIGDGVNAKCELENTGNASAALQAIGGADLRCRIRMKKSASAGTTATFNIWLAETTSGNAIAGMQLTANSLSSSEWRWVDGLVSAGAAYTYTTNTRIRISDGGTGAGGTAIPNNEWLAIDRMEFYPGNQAYNPHLVRWSSAEQPDAYDSLTGIQVVAENNGQRLVTGFTLGNQAYLVKERSLYTTTDDGFSEPAFWGVSQISDIYGTPSHKGVALGDRWAVIAGRAGLAYFSGGQPFSLSEDIRGTWNRINWQYGNTIWVGVDTQNRRIKVGVPLDGATTPSTIISLEYYGDSPDQSRNFNRWFVTDTTLMCYTGSERSDGTRLQLFGTNNANGRVAKLDESVHADFSSVPINSAYRMAYLGDTGRKLTGHLTANVYGSGTLIVTGYLPDNATTITSTNRGAPNITLQNPFKQDVEWIIGATGERISWQVQTNAVGDWFSLQKFAAYVKSKPGTPLRGTRGA